MSVITSKGINPSIEANALECSGTLTQETWARFLVEEFMVAKKTVGEGYFVTTPKGVPIYWVPPRLVPLWSKAKIDSEVEKLLAEWETSDGSPDPA